MPWKMPKRNLCKPNRIADTLEDFSLSLSLSLLSSIHRLIEQALDKIAEVKQEIGEKQGLQLA